MALLKRNTEKFSLYKIALLVVIEHMESVKFVHVAVRAGEDFILAVTYFD
jgi:hypothetical protein